MKFFYSIQDCLCKNQVVKACKFHLYSVKKPRYGNSIFPHKSKTKMEKEVKD